MSNFVIPPVPAETRNHSLNDILTDNDFFGNSTLTGITITQSKALELAPYFEAVDIISGDIAKLPFKTYRRIPDTDNGREVAVNSPSFRLLNRRPNDAMTPFVFMKSMAADAIQGNAYAFIAKDQAGSPRELIKLDPFNTTPVRIQEKDRNGLVTMRLWYMTTTDSGQQVWMEENEVLHIKGLSPDGLVGYSVWDKARQSLGIAYASQAYGAKFFANDASPTVALEVPTKLGQEARDNLRKSWNDKHSGQNNFHKTAVLEEGVTLKQYGINAKDAQLLETRRFSVTEIAGWFRLPPHKLGDDARISYNSLEQENQSYLDTCLDHWLVAFEQEFMRKLLTPSQQSSGSMFIEANREALLRIDSTTKWNTFSIGVNNGILSRNEVRAKLNMNPVEGLDDYTIPLNLGVVGEDEEGTDESIDQIGDSDPAPEETPLDEEVEDDVTVPDEEGDEASRAMMGATLDRIVKRWTSMMVKTMNSKKHKSPDKAYEAYRNDLARAQGNVQEELGPFCKAANIDEREATLSLIVRYDDILVQTRDMNPEKAAETLQNKVIQQTLDNLGV